MSGRPHPVRRHHRAGAAAFFAGVALAFAGAGVVHAGHIRGLTDDVVIDGVNVGQLRLYVGTHNFLPTGNEGIGRASRTDERSGFYPAGGRTLQQAARASGRASFNWLQIVTAQPRSHNRTFGVAPHADPSNDPDNPTPRDVDPWYLNVGADGAAPMPAVNRQFDLPAMTNNVLPFQDFPFGFARGESISFATYLVSVDAAARTYEIHAGFHWAAGFAQLNAEQAPRLHITQLEVLEPALLQPHQELTAAYGGRGWTLVPEPGTLMLIAVAATGLGRRRYARSARTR